uniref:TROVE domain-containing protein n=1 Tax=Chromera velia CCMP2878 TaxID=1169474 RepID=A0A0G4GYC8_9ALVE|eukprot:Cvel_5384.t1-p1 / transcript=Cvel_5384.t1 / gene=Cvel_5384 / organism=Chromera_velia_CCMP2878 / gene_product=Uncharacterized protein L728, putative / transcript_product=Uncharacterized protein L728, putative / location=Cvel_scaffold250:80942-82774(+) / protein_length=611 / sequence_SO=supercontig / SO=protein_coding / is_pseudo=false
MRTENGALAFRSSGSACVDFFFEMVPRVPDILIERLLEGAWAENPQTAQKLIFHVGAVKEGKQDRRNFYFCMDWLRRHHFETFLANLQHSVHLVCWKTALGLLSAAVEGVAPLLEREDIDRYKRRREEISDHHLNVRRPRCRQRAVSRRQQKETLSAAAYKAVVEQRRQAAAASNRAAAATAREARQVLAQEREGGVRQLEQRDGQFVRFKEKVAELFADQLQRDKEAMESGNRVAGLCAKWAPSFKNAHDKRTQIQEAIVRKLYPEERFRLAHGGASDAEFLSLMRDRFRKEYLSPLRAYSRVPEVFMGTNRWAELPYSRVPSKCMTLRESVFRKHDGERFEAFLEQVKRGDKKVAAGALLPHEIIKPFVKNTFGFVENGDEDREADTTLRELQWERLVRDVKEGGQLGSCIPVSDVSGSMYGEPLLVCVALGLLASRATSGIWREFVCTFSNQPSLVRVRSEGQSLSEQCASLQEINWGMDTDLNAVFRLLLQVAQKHSIGPEEMAKKILVFSDMEFNQAGGGRTNFEEAEKDFEAAGYRLPQIVFWNLRSSSGAKPVVATQKGAALVSGFSKNLMKSFLEGNLEEFTPFSLMMKALSRECFSDLRVVD